MNESQLCFIGAGNVARSLIGGLLADGFPADRIRASDPDAGQREAVARRFGVQVFADNAEALAGAQVLILAVKPQGLAALARGLAPQLDAANPLLISVAAGIRASDLGRWLGGNRPLVRCMPNTPALVQSGATALYATAAVNDAQRNLAESILRAVGLTLWVEDETQMDAVTALSGSGPAYFFLMIEAMQQAGTDLGLPADTARLLALQTAFGAAKMALESEDPPGRLRERVTSPGGTTERALAALEDGGFRALIARAMQAAQARSRELAEQLGADA
ncbi:MAG TPA: pyrroline-5-carboxylate reductase [Thiohalobacter sp.]|nr:pyrroline-5-carboxylate reductase [Thiohalobacter sp.]